MGQWVSKKLLVRMIIIKSEIVKKRWHYQFSFPYTAYPIQNIVMTG